MEAPPRLSPQRHAANAIDGNAKARKPGDQQKASRCL
jgi:hypothetical protein